MKLLVRLLILQVIALNSAQVVAYDSVAASIKHCNKFYATDESMSYLSRDLAQELGRRLNTTVVDVKAPIKRCVELMKTDQVDFMLYAHKTDERSKYMDFIHSSKNEKVVFMIRRKDGNWLRNFSDLKTKTLGMINGYNYPSQLHADIDIHKLLVMKPKQLPKILLAGRVNAFVTFQGHAHTIAVAYPDIVTASYDIEHFDMSFIVINKASSLYQRLDEVKRVSLNMIGDGYFDMKLEEYLPGAISPFPKNANQH